MKNLLRLALLAPVAIAIAGCEPPEPIIQKRVYVLERANPRGKQNCLNFTIGAVTFDELLSKGVKVTGERREFSIPNNGPNQIGYSCDGSIYILEGKKSLIDSILYNSEKY